MAEAVADGKEGGDVGLGDGDSFMMVR